jgi:uncharacterized RDD family membrane protein YckC
MSIVTLDTGFNIEIEFPITPLHKRLLAWLIDMAIQIAYIGLAQKIFTLFPDDRPAANSVLLVLCLLPILLYYLVAEMIMNGQSPGKKAMGIKVITIEGGQPSISQYLIRWVFRSVDFPYLLIILISRGGLPSWTSILIFSGLACLLFTKKSQRIGDLIAGTVLIDTTSKTTWQDTVFMEVEENYQPAFPEVMRLSDRDINSIRQVLAMAQDKYHNREYAEKVASKLQKALQLSVDMDCIDFLEKLVKDYNYLSNR